MRVALGVAVLVLSFLGVANPAALAATPSPYLEDLTWTEVRDALASGTTTIIIPVGGTEQNGPHMVLGKHNVRARVLAGRIAARLGDALVAPVLEYVPEGSIAPPSGHMRFPGTISIPVSAFKGTLEGAAESFRQAGFSHIVLIGDHGGYQDILKGIAEQLNRAWAGGPCRIHYVADYYRITQTAYLQALRSKGLSDAEIGTHAGTADTALALAIDSGLVRSDRLANAPDVHSGVQGDPRPATATLGQLGVELIVDDTVAAIRKARLEKR